jgi:alkylation response protein AidB-like acyl-CoA dehydrogenase
VNLELDPREIQLQQDAKNVAEHIIAPFAETIDQKAELPTELLAKLKESGILKPFLPKELGGEDLGLMPLAILLEEISRVSPVIGILFAQQVVLGIRATLKSWNHPKRDVFATRAADFDALFAIAATETGAGCDLSLITTSCRKNPDGSFQVSGGKAYVNWANRVACMFVYAGALDTDPVGSTLIGILTPNQGLSIGHAQPTMGLGGIEAAPVELNIPEIPADHLAGTHGFGKDVYDRVMMEMRIALSAVSVGLSQQAFDDAADHAKTRKQFGKPVGSFQSLQWRFADAATRIEASRMHTWHAVEVANKKLVNVRQAAMAKVYASETAFMVADFAVQVLGSRGFTYGTRVERLFRDSRFLKIGLGTSEVLRNLMATQL